MYYIFIILFDLCVGVLLKIEDSNYLSMLDVPSFVALLILFLLALFFTSNIKNYLRSFKFVVQKKEKIKQDELSSSIKSLDFSLRVFPCFAIILLVVSVICMLGNLEDKRTLGPKLAIALVSCLYSSCMCLFLMVKRWILMGKKDSEK